MKKLAFIIALLGVLLGLAAAPALATPIADLTALARYFPQGAPVFVSLRTDDAYLNQLDSVINQVINKLPPGTLPPISLKGLLNLAVTEQFGDSFDNVIRSWLGDSIALGYPTPESVLGTDTAPLIAVTITDRARAEACLDQVTPSIAGMTRQPGDGPFTLYASADSIGMAFLVNDEVVLIGVDSANVQSALNTAAPLSQDAAFSAALDLLPEDDYNILAYLNLRGVLAAAADQSGLSMAVLDAVGAQAIGLTILDGRSLVADVVTNGNLRALQTLGLAAVGSSGPIDLGFAAHIPAQTRLVIHFSNFKAIYEATLESVRASASPADQAALDEQFNQIGLVVQAVLGLDLEDDLLSWLTGDFALFLSLDGEALVSFVEQTIAGGAPPELSALPVDVGLVVEATDPAKAQALTAALGRVLPQLTADSPDIRVSQGQVGGVDVTLLSQSVPVSPIFSLPLEVAIGADERVFVIATRPAAEAIFSGMPGLDTTPGYAEAGRYLLDNPTQLWYMDGRGLGLLVGVGLLTLGPVSPEISGALVTESGEITPMPIPTPDPIDIEQRRALADQAAAVVRSAFEVISSSSISQADLGGGQSAVRLVITLPK